MGNNTLTLRQPRAVISHEFHPRVSPALTLAPTKDIDTHTNRCYILIGLPATGKTHWCDTIMKNWRSGGRPIIIREDDFVEDECQRTGKSFDEVFTSFCLADRKRIFAERFHAAIGVSRDIIVDGHNLNEDGRAELLALLPDTYQKIGIIFTAPDRLILERLTTRYAGVDGAPSPSLLLQNLKRRFHQPEWEEFDRVTNIDHTCRYG